MTLVTVRAEGKMPVVQTTSRLHDRSDIVGTVLDASGSPVVGAWAYTVGSLEALDDVPGFLPVSQQTNHEGRFEMTPEPSGTWDVEVKRDGFRRLRIRASTREPLTLRLVAWTDN